MGEVLTPKRQIVVDRLKRRFDHYRKHQNACLPRYKQSTNSVIEKQRQETFLLKQRYLESKAKKAKTGKNSNEHHKHTAVKESVPDTQKLTHPRPVKKFVENSPVIVPTHCDTSADDLERSTKNAKPSSCESDPLSEHHSKKLPNSNLPAPKRQFPSKSRGNSKDQQFPTKVGCAKLLEGCREPTIKANDLINPSQPEVVPPVKSQSVESISVPNETGKESTTSCNRTPNVVECKQEKEKETSSDLCQFQENVIDYNEDLLLQHREDQLSDGFPSISGFPDDSGDDVIHSDLLDFIDIDVDDVFTNAGDIIIDFDDSVGSVKIGEDEDNTSKNNLIKASSPYQSSVDALTFSVNPQDGPQQSQGLFENSLSAVSTSVSSSTKSALSTVTSTLGSMTKAFAQSQQQCLPTLTGRSPAHQLPDNLSLDFKLTEPSPAAHTLKQMAEQHQNMQQKQQLGRSLESANTDTFNVDPFSNPTPFSFRNRFLINENLSTSKLSNSSLSLFNSTPLRPELPYPGVEPIRPFKRESFKGHLQSQSEQLMMRATGHTEQKSPFLTSARSGWPLDASGHSNVANNPMDNPYLTTDARSQVNEGHVLGMEYDTRTMQQEQKTTFHAKQQDGMTQQPYSNDYNVYIPQQSTNSGADSMFSPPLSQSMSYNTQFTSAIGPLSPEYKLDQLNTINLVGQAPLQTPMTYQQAFMKQQQMHHQNMNNHWRQVLPQNSLNIGSYQYHDGYRQLSSCNSQMASTTSHHNFHHQSYRGSNGHGSISRPNISPMNNQSIIQHHQQINPQFQQRQSFPS